MRIQTIVLVMLASGSLAGCDKGDNKAAGIFSFGSESDEQDGSKPEGTRVEAGPQGVQVEADGARVQAGPQRVQVEADGARVVTDKNGSVVVAAPKVTPKTTVAAESKPTPRPTKPGKRTKVRIDSDEPDGDGRVDVRHGDDEVKVGGRNEVDVRAGKTKVEIDRRGNVKVDGVGL